MARRYRFIILGAVLGLAAMPVTMALAWGLLLALDLVPVFGDGKGAVPALPVAGLLSFLVAVVVALFLAYQGYRLDRKDNSLSSSVIREKYEI